MRVAIAADHSGEFLLPSSKSGSCWNDGNNRPHPRLFANKGTCMSGSDPSGIHTEYRYLVASLENLQLQAPETARLNLQRLCQWWKQTDEQETVDDHSPPPWFTTLLRILNEAPLKDEVLNAVEVFVRNARKDFNPFQLFNQSPRALEIIARLACSSPFLTRTLQADPLFLTELTLDGRTADTKDREQFVAEAERLINETHGRSLRMGGLRKYQRRQLLRIGICDAFGLMDLRFITLQLSLLADAMVQCCLSEAAAELHLNPHTVTVIALGKLGGEELNYSSDIDLTLIAENPDPQLQRLAQSFIDWLSANVGPGFLYRVDLRLRPWGDAGPLVSSVEGYRSYLQCNAELWEKQAMLKARAIAGSPRMGRDFLSQIQPLLFTGSAAEIRSNINAMKSRIESRLRKKGKLHTEVKLGAGSIRDIEFLVQSLQLMHGAQTPWILSANTLDALVRLTEPGLINALWYRQLRSGYVFLRTIEHSLQLLHNQQTHELPTNPNQLNWLAFRLDYPDSETFLERFEQHRSTIRTIFEQCLFESTPLAAVDSVPVHARRPEYDQSIPNDDILNLRRPELERLLAQVDAETKCRVQIQAPRKQNDLLEILIVGKRFSGWLSAICGLMTTTSLDIRNGDAAAEEFPGGQPLPEGCFAAGLTVAVTTATNSTELAGTLQNAICEFGQLSDEHGAEYVSNELIIQVRQTMSGHEASGQTFAEAEIAVDIQQQNASSTRVEITGNDSRGFLFELFGALSFSGFHVLRAVIRSDGRKVNDLLFVREPDGSPVSSDERQDELRIAATLIKQFTHWLPSSGDPAQSLRRFRELVARLRPRQSWESSMHAMLAPGVLPRIARVLSMSQYLWETLLRLPAEEIPATLALPESLKSPISQQELQQQLERKLSSAVNSGWDMLNDFKDQQLFRIEMRHTLGHCTPFGAFSKELTDLAEVIITSAVETGWKQLSSALGDPWNDLTNSPCQCTIAALGKFGGVELGFASDIEIMLIYEAAGKTNGSQSTSNAEFFERLIRLLNQEIRSAQDGIFQLDLRMRPYGKAGPTAVLLENLTQYYAVGGPAWPFERQAMVRFRPVAGSKSFGQQVAQVVHAICYHKEQFDFDAMRAMRERQIRQLVFAGRIHAKLSDGGLVDCEYAVQALQLVWGKRYPALQQTNTLAVLKAASDCSLISKDDAATVQNACIFLRELIDCLRMVRGNAQDLNVPEQGSAAWNALAQRMQQVHGSHIPLNELEQQMAVIRQFSERVRQLVANFS